MESLAQQALQLEIRFRLDSEDSHSMCLDYYFVRGTGNLGKVFLFILQNLNKLLTKYLVQGMAQDLWRRQQGEHLLDLFRIQWESRRFEGMWELFHHCSSFRFLHTNWRHCTEFRMVLARWWCKRYRGMRIIQWGQMRSFGRRKRNRSRDCFHQRREMHVILFWCVWFTLCCFQ